MQQAVSVLIALFVALTNGAVAVPFRTPVAPEAAGLTQATPLVAGHSVVEGQETPPTRMAESEGDDGTALRSSEGTLRHTPTSRLATGAAIYSGEPSPQQEPLGAPVFGVSRHLTLSEPHPRAP